MNEHLNSNDFFTTVVETYSDTIYRIALNITKNRQDAFDVCQDVFVRLVKNKSKIKDDEHLKAWILRTAVNCSKSNCTQAYKRHTVAFDSVDEKLLAKGNNADSVIDSVLILPKKYRCIIHLFYYEDLKISEIAQICNISESAVKSRLKRGRDKLKIILEKENSYE